MLLMILNKTADMQVAKARITGVIYGVLPVAIQERMFSEMQFRLVRLSLWIFEAARQDCVTRSTSM
jgi:hypothetical protein